MLKLMRLYEIRDREVGSPEWKSAVCRLTIMCLTETEQESLIKNKVLIKTILTDPHGIDQKRYQCVVQIALIGSQQRTECVSYEAEIPVI